MSFNFFMIYCFTDSVTVAVNAKMGIFGKNTFTSDKF